MIQGEREAWRAGFALELDSVELGGHSGTSVFNFKRWKGMEEPVDRHFWGNGVHLHLIVDGTPVAISSSYG